jgi:hypothetical protein
MFSGQPVYTGSFVHGQAGSEATAVFGCKSTKTTAKMNNSRSAIRTFISLSFLFMLFPPVAVPELVRERSQPGYQHLRRP